MNTSAPVWCGYRVAMTLLTVALAVPAAESSSEREQRFARNAAQQPLLRARLVEAIGQQQRLASHAERCWIHDEMTTRLGLAIHADARELPFARIRMEEWKDSVPVDMAASWQKHAAYAGAVGGP